MTLTGQQFTYRPMWWIRRHLLAPLPWSYWHGLGTKHGFRGARGCSGSAPAWVVFMARRARPIYSFACWLRYERRT